MNKRLRFLWLLLILPVLCVISCAAFALITRIQDDYRKSLDDSSKYVIGFADMLGSGWKVTDVMRDDEDLSGWSDTIAGRSQIWTYNVSDRLSFIKNHVIAYVDDASAQTGFNSQKAMLSYSSDKLRLFTLNDKLVLKSQASYTGCYELEIETRCDILLLYGSHLVYMNAFPKRNGRPYFSLDELEKILVAMDEHMSQLVSQ